DDGRAVPTFIAQALTGEPLTVHGDGSQTRSLCYVDDLIEGFWRLIASDEQDPVNLGNPEEVSVLELAEAIRETAGSRSEIVFTERPVDDPEVRCPDISRARDRLGWEPQVPLREGLKPTVAWAREAWADQGR
ncbi:MAG: GDP-mannose 4,6-dehydratase, partial [Actinomycetota bacterium]